METLIYLELIRATGNQIDIPIPEFWRPLEPVLEDLRSQGYIDTNYKVTAEGKKLLLLFRDQMSDIIKPFDIYKEYTLPSGEVVDARIAVLSYAQPKLLRDLTTFILWDKIFDDVKRLKTTNNFLNIFNNTIDYYADKKAWIKLGRTRQEALVTCEKLINPKPERSLVKL